MALPAPEKMYVDLDLNQQQLLNPRYQIVSEFPRDPKAGQFCYLLYDYSNYVGNLPYYFNGITWMLYGGFSTTLSGILKSNSGVLDVANDGDITSFLLTGYVLGSNTTILDTDSILIAFGKIQAQINSLASATVVHNSTTSKQGGSVPLNEFFHLTQSEHTTVLSIDQLNDIGFIKRNGPGDFSIETGAITVLTKEIYYLEYSLPEIITNSVDYLHSFTKASPNMRNIKSGSATGLLNVNSAYPIISPINGTIKRAILKIEGAGVQNNSVSYPCYASFDVVTVGHTTGGTSNTISFSISNAYPVDTFSPGNTEAFLELTGLSISALKGVSIAIKTNISTSPYGSASTIAHFKNMSLTLVIEEN